MIARGAVCLAMLLIACSSKDAGTSPVAATTTTVTLGPAVATDTYRPSNLTASWSGFCPAASPSSVTINAGDAYQLVNRTDRSLDVQTLAGRVPLETIAAGATGAKHTEFGAVSQSSFTFSLTVAGCTDAASAQGLVNVTVSSK